MCTTDYVSGLKIDIASIGEFWWMNFQFMIDLVIMFTLINYI